jgi:hypothetical protein
VGAHNWFSKFGRIGLVYNAYDLIAGTPYPVGSATCPGCYLTHDIGRAVFLQTVLPSKFSLRRPGSGSGRRKLRSEAHRPKRWCYSCGKMTAGAGCAGADHDVPSANVT